MNKYSIIAENISKSYSNVEAIKNINFNVNSGELFGFIGPDGAGKTTIFRILTTLLIPTTGKATVEGLDVVKDYRKLRDILGYMPGRFSLYQDLSVEENLNFFATIFDTTIKKNYDLIKDIYIQIEPFKTRKAGALSGGMKQKLALCCAMIHKPKVLVLDEPTTGVDAVSRKEFWEMLKRLKQSGITIIVSTPYMDEASLCDRVALIQSGNIMRIDTPDNITSGFKNTIFEIRSNNMFKLLNDLRAFKTAKSVFPFGQHVHYTDFSSQIKNEEIINYIELKDHKDIEVKTINANIEDCFMELMSSDENSSNPQPLKPPLPYAK